MTFAPVSEDRPDPTPTKDPLVVVPVTPRDVRVPTELMLGCAEAVTVPALDATDTVPVTFAPARFERPPPSPVKSVPTRGPDKTPPVRGKKLKAGEPVRVPYGMIEPLPAIMLLYNGREDVMFEEVIRKLEVAAAEPDDARYTTEPGAPNGAGQGGPGTVESAPGNPCIP